MKKIYYFLLCLIIFIITIRISYIYYYKHDYYYEEYLKKTNKIVYGLTAPRGKILDRNGKILVDNIGDNTIVYFKMNNLNETDIAYKLENILENNLPSTVDEQKKYYLEKNNTDFLLTPKELKDYYERKISIDKINELKYQRLDPYLKYNDQDKNMIHIYYLLNKGYSYSNKIIKKGASLKECALVNDLNIKGLRCEYTTKRVYLYDTLNAIYGKVGQISKENKDYYLNKGYSLNDEVGLSYLEKEYDDYLRGTKAKYILNKDNTLTLLSNATRGNDIVLSIDIDLQLKINEIIKKNLDQAPNYKNTDYYNTSYVIVSNPYTGEIIASTGISKINNEFHDVTTNLLTSSFTVGSVVKGASMTVGYQNNLIEEGKLINDSCVKLYLVPEKCSFKRLGYIDDITALKTSSNYYQFLLAIKLTGNKYYNNIKINANENHFNTYRNTFSSFGLGSSTGIDLENESLGIKGQIIADDLLLNLSIGQYDTYTPLQLINYINTIATNGKRYSLHYLKQVINNDKNIYEYQPNLLNIVENTNFERIKEGFRQVLFIGTGKGYTDLKYLPAGKTGTSEVVYSKDVTTINQTYIMYGPYDNPKYSIVVLSPNVSYNNNRDNYIAPINRNISKEVSNLVFEK